MERGFGGRNPFGGLGDLNRLVKQAQKMQEDLAAAQEELEAVKIEASSGGGAVTATVTGKGTLVDVKIRPEVLDPDDVEMLQDLIVTAVREAQTQAEALAQRRMQEITGSSGLPPGLV